MEKKITELGKSYWDENGAYQKEYDELYKALVPNMGEADTVHGEMIRAVSRLFYDFCNNGNCNVIEIERDTCSDCCGSGYDEEEEEDYTDCACCDGEGYTDGDVIIDDYYQDMIDVIGLELINTKPLENLKAFLHKPYSRYSFNDKEMKVYNDLVDEVMHHVLTTENKSRTVKTN